MLQQLTPVFTFLWVLSLQLSQPLGKGQDLLLPHVLLLQLQRSLSQQSALLLFRGQAGLPWKRNALIPWATLVQVILEAGSWEE